MYACMQVFISMYVCMYVGTDEYVCPNIYMSFALVQVSINEGM
jgi:hypothetical protein